MKIGVVVFPGSNCDDDMIHVLTNVVNAEAIKVWHKESSIDHLNLDGIVLPGGFSYGDYLRCGAIAKLSPVMQEVVRFANNGGFVWGICNGFQILCEAGLLPGVLLSNKDKKFICKNIYLKTDNNKTIITNKLSKNQVIKIPIAHAEGRYFIDENGLATLKDNEQIIFSYCDEYGNLSEESNINGSLESIAGIANKSKNVFGMMPHPERASEAALGNIDGRYILDSLSYGLMQMA